MKKQIALFMGLLALIPSLLLAQSTVSDTTIRFRNKVVKIEDQNNEVKVKVYESQNGKDTVSYKQLYEGIFSEGKSFEKWTVMEDLGIQLPTFGKGKKDKNYRMKAHYAGFGIGFANLIDDRTTSTYTKAIPIKVNETTEWFINFSEHIVPIYRNNLGITTGLGIGWHTYRLDNNQMLQSIGGVTQVIPFERGEVEYSRLKITRLTVPVMLEWQFGNRRPNYFHLAAGAEAGIKTYSTYKVKYRDADGKTLKQITGRGLNTNPISLDLIAQGGMGNISIFAKYGLVKIFEDNRGPAVRPVSIGLLFHF